MDMNSDITAAQLLIQAAMQALKKGDRLRARRYAEQATVLAPQIEQPWLILGYLADSPSAQYYLERALQVDPTSQQALAALAWLKEKSVQKTEPAGLKIPGTSTIAERRQPRSTIRRGLRFSAWLVLLTVLVCLAALNGVTRQVESQDAQLVRIVQTVINARPTLESSLTPSLTWAPVPTETPTTTSTASPIPTGTPTTKPTSTSTATAKPTSTQLPSPTPLSPTPVININYTVLPGDSLYLIAQHYNVLLQNLIVANNIGNGSFIQAGQVLSIPSAGLPPAALPTAALPLAAMTGQGKEIQIDISEQHIYAYQDNKLVFSFVASTGIGNSTRIGTFKVLDKIPKAFSNSFNIWMPYWLGIYYSGTLENGIHGLPLLMNGLELWGNLLGKPATYGCIEAKTTEIKKLFDWAEIGTPVIIRR